MYISRRIFASRGVIPIGVLCLGENVAKQASPRGQWAFRASGAELVRWMHLDIEGGRLHAWSWFMEDDCRQRWIQARTSVGCVPEYFKACVEWKSETTGNWRRRAKGVLYVCTDQFGSCLEFCSRTQGWGWRVLIEWDYACDRGWWQNTSLPAMLTQQPMHFDFSSGFRSRLGQRDMAIRPAKRDFWRCFRSEPGQCDMASRPSQPSLWSQLQ